MAVQDPIDWQPIEDAIYDWFTDNSGINAFWAAHDSPQFEYPYGTLQLISGPSTIGSYDDKVQNNGTTTVTIEHVGIRNIVVSVQVDACPNPKHVINESRRLLERAQASLNLDSVCATLREANLAIVNIGDITTLDFSIDDTWISRANMDITLRLVSLVTEDVSAIDTVNIEWQDLGVTFPVDVS